MSDMVDFLSLYAQQPPRTINNPIRKQQSATKLINTYLSTAAQYLNRTKSFHIPPSTSSQIGDGSNSHVSYAAVFGPPAALLASNHLNLTRSVPSNMNNLYPSSPAHEPMSSDVHVNGKKKAKENKSHGFVNTLRRSLRKNKERFYNKRATTMKSCQSLSNYDPTTIGRSPASITPTLPCRRREYTEDAREPPSLTMITKHRRTHVDQSNDDSVVVEADDRMRKNSSCNGETLSAESNRNFVLGTIERLRETSDGGSNPSMIDL